MAEKAGIAEILARAESLGYSSPYSTAQTAEILGLSKRRIQQAAYNQNIGHRSGSFYTFANEDLLYLSNRMGMAGKRIGGKRAGSEGDLHLLSSQDLLKAPMQEHWDISPFPLAAAAGAESAMSANRAEATAAIPQSRPPLLNYSKYRRAG